MDCSLPVPLFMEFSKQEYWSAFPFPSPGGLPDPGVESESLALQADSFSFELPGKPSKYITVQMLAREFSSLQHKISKAYRKANECFCFS